MTVSLCKHGFSLQPPHGFTNPGPCLACGISWDEFHAELAQQGERLRAGTAHEGRCDGCAKYRMLFRYQPGQELWLTTRQAHSWLCTTCWGVARENEEHTGFATFQDLFDHGSDDQLARALGIETAS